MEDVRIQARDGLELVAYLTRAKADTPTPLVLCVHGGPWARDFWGFNSAAQWFANRGYACLQVNYRGSSGYGKSFLHKGDKEWGVGAMQHDLTDAVQWAVDQKIADPENVCIYGGSYGGSGGAKAFAEIADSTSSMTNFRGATLGCRARDRAAASSQRQTEW